MIGVIAILKVQAGKTAEFEAAFTALAAQVRASEPGNLAYALTKSRSEPDTYKVLEMYVDEEALNAHREAAHFKAMGAALGPFMAGRPEIELLDGV